MLITPSPPAAQPKSRPINLRPWEVRAFMDGAKTMIRRPVKGQPFRTDTNVRLLSCKDGVAYFADFISSYCPIKCPFGRSGDLVYGKEGFREVEDPGAPDSDIKWTYWDGDESHHISVDYQIDGAHRLGDRHRKPQWKSSALMPRWATRLHFTIAAIRIERIQAISEADALAEGIRLLNGRYTFNGGLHESRDPVASYRAAWESMYGDGAWERDEWVWCLTIERAVI